VPQALARIDAPTPQPDHTSLFEGASVELQPAPFFKRALAFTVDLGVISAISYGGFLVLAMLLAGGAGTYSAMARMGRIGKGVFPMSGVIFLIAVVAIFLILVLLLFDGSFIFFESRQGTTPGKRLLGLKVISLRGDRLTLGQCTIRELLRHIDCLMVVPGVLSFVLTRRHQRLGDLLAATQVVHSARRENQTRYLYVTQEDYAWVRETLQPIEVTPQLAKTFLSLAYPCFILGTRSLQPTEQAQWELEARAHFPALSEGALDSRSLLKLFAEHCFQCTNHHRP
jgi:uncharacterized RDD family membrane protein YckC